MPDIEPNALIILVIMIVGGLKWFLENFKGKKEADDADAETPFVDLYEEARQEIQERQNRQYPSPQSEEGAHYEEYLDPQVFAPVAVAPPPVPGASRIPAPPPLPGAKAPFQRKAQQVTRPKLSVAEKAALKRVQEQARKGAQTTARHRRSTRSHVRKLLSSPTAARDAIVLREILSTPRGQL